MKRARRAAWRCWAAAVACQTPGVLVRWALARWVLAPSVFRLFGVEDIGGRRHLGSGVIHPTLWGTGVRIEWIVLAVATAWAVWRVAWSLAAMLGRPAIPRGVARWIGWRRPTADERAVIEATVAPLEAAARHRGMPWHPPLWWVIDREGRPAIERVGGTLIADVGALGADEDAATARTAQVAAATGAVTDRAVAGFDISLLRMLARRTAVRGSRFAGVPISGPGLDAAWLVDDGVRASASAFEGVEGFLRKAFGWSLLLVSGECGLRWLADFGLAESAERAAVLDSDRWAVTLGAGPELLAWLHLAAPVLDKPEPWRWTPPPSTALRSQNIEDALLGG